MLAFAALGTNICAAPASAAPESKPPFTWNHDIKRGDCTLFHGASWVINSDGTANFDGIVTSGSNNDAWLMWVDLKDSNHAVLGRLRNVDFVDPADQDNFVHNLPDKNSTYHWRAKGEFDRSLYPLIAHLGLRSHC
ncbi:DUF6294 family protein [Nocardia sp. 2TAF39]